MLRAIFAILVFLIFPFASFSQESTPAKSELAALRQAMERDRAAVDALVLYPEDVGTAILEASLHPEVIAKLAAVQARSSASFKTFIAPLKQNEQEQIYEIIRYPDLLALIVNAQKSQTLIVKEIQKYPKALGGIALQVGIDPEKYDLLVNIYNLNKSVQEVVNNLLASYPATTKAAFQTLIAHPETLSILSKNMNLTVVLGALYKKDPSFTKGRARARHEAAIKKSNEMVQQWKLELEKTPGALSELENSAGVFAKKAGYEPEEAMKAPSAEDEIDVTSHPYPYWFGYPSWRTVASWYPYPPYYDWGFYYGPNKTLTIIGLPSYDFVDWILQGPANLENYSHLADLFLVHYEEHPESTDSFTVAVGNWLAFQKDQIPSEWLKKDESRSARLMEYGRLQQESEGQNFNLSKRKEYVEVQAEKYPGLNFNLPPIASNLSVPKAPQMQYQPPTHDLSYYRAMDYGYSYWNNPSGQLFSIPIKK